MIISGLIFLIGLPGSGKTTIGKNLSSLLDIPFLDTDERIVEKEKRSIDDIFLAEGEEYFRKLEKQVLQDLLTNDTNAVISTGGGLPCFFDNMEQINKKGVSVFLNVPPETIADRLWNQRDHNRPMIKGKSKDELLKFLKKKSEERCLYYSKATYTFSGDTISAEEIKKSLNLYFQD